MNTTTNNTDTALDTLLADITTTTYEDDDFRSLMTDVSTHTLPTADTTVEPNWRIELHG